MLPLTLNRRTLLLGAGLTLVEKGVEKARQWPWKAQQAPEAVSDAPKWHPDVPFDPETHGSFLDGLIHHPMTNPLKWDQWVALRKWTGWPIQLNRGDETCTAHFSDSCVFRLWLAAAATWFTKPIINVNKLSGPPARPNPWWDSWEPSITFDLSASAAWHAPHHYGRSRLVRLIVASWAGDKSVNGWIQYRAAPGPETPDLDYTP